MWARAEPGRAAVRGLCIAAALALSMLGATAHAHAAPASQATAIGSGGAAATVDPAATQAAIKVLRQGGNAVDAAIAAAGVLGVTEPFSSGIGGGGFMLIRTPAGKVATIDGRETAPAAFKPRSFFEKGKPLEFDPARYSGLSAGTPGTVATWAKALRSFGTISLGKALQPGIGVARRGFRIDRTFFQQVGENVEYFRDVPATAAIYLDRNGTPRNIGTKLRNPDLARAYARIGKRGLAGFYRGPIAKALVKTARRPPVAEDARHRWRPGLLTAGDLTRYKALTRKPTQVTYRGLTVWGMAPPSSGGSTVGEILNILEGYEPLGATRAEGLHRFLEASRYAYADRGEYLGDPAFTKVPLAGLLSDSFAGERRALITGKAADAREVKPGVPPGVKGSSRASAGADREGKSTTHLTVADRRGMVVSYTFTIESTGGNGLVVPGWGFLLNNELTDFDYDDPKAANAPAAGKRPRSSMAPTLVTRTDGSPVLALGSPGGSTIITTVAQILVERLDFGRSLPAAISAARASQQNATETSAEPGFISSAAGKELRSAYGHKFIPAEPNPPGEIGAATAIEFLTDGRMQAVAEPKRRGGGSALAISGG